MTWGNDNMEDPGLQEPERNHRFEEPEEPEEPTPDEQDDEGDRVHEGRWA